MISKLDLGGSWTLSQVGKSESFPATVPGCVHTDLMAAGRLEDPFVRDRELSVQWIGESAWAYRRDFDVEKAFLENDKVVLHCEGLDTLAAISINGKALAKTDNMFRTWSFDVKRLLKPGRNSIEIRFDSAVEYVKRRQKARALPGWGGPLEIKGRAWLRKQPCNFGWDWGPVLVTAGIWRAIRLEAWDTARLDDVLILQHHGKTKVDLECRVGVAGKATASLRVAVSKDGKTLATQEGPVKKGAAVLRLPVDKPELWWPSWIRKPARSWRWTCRILS